AIHVVDVVAQEQVQVLDAAARVLELDRIELKQQIVSERSREHESSRQGMVEFGQQGSQNGERRGLLAALLFREQLRQGLQYPSDCAVGCFKRFPVGMIAQNDIQHLRERRTSRVQCLDRDTAADGDDLERRSKRSDIPARVALRVFVAGGEVDAAMSIKT